MRKSERDRDLKIATSACHENHPEARPSNHLMPVVWPYFDGHWTGDGRPIYGRLSGRKNLERHGYGTRTTDPSTP
jgi:hypothetical protein